MKHWAILNFEIKQAEASKQAEVYRQLRLCNWQKITELATIWTKVFEQDNPVFIRELAAQEVEDCLTEVGLTQPHYHGFLAVSNIEPYDF